MTFEELNSREERSGVHRFAKVVISDFEKRISESEEKLLANGLKVWVGNQTTQDASHGIRFLYRDVTKH